MVRRAARTDSNQGEIVAWLRAAGAFVEPRLAAVGKGVPDLLVIYQGRVMLFEVKDGSKAVSRRELTEDEKQWHARASDHGVRVHVVESVYGAMAALGINAIGSR